MADLEHADAEVREEAVEVLGSIGSPSAITIPALVKALGDDATDYSARNVLVGFGEPAVPALIEAVRSGIPKARANAAEVLGRIGPSAVIAGPVLVAALGDKDYMVCNDAKEALEKMGVSVLSAIVEGVVSRKWKVQRDCETLLRKLGAEAKPAIPALLNYIQDPDADRRRLLMGCLAHIGPDSPQVHDVLLDSIGDDEERSRWSVPHWFGYMGRPGITFLVQSLENPARRDQARRVLNKIRSISLDPEEIAELLAGVQGGGSRQGRISLILLSRIDFSEEALQGFDLSTVSGHVLPFLTHNDPITRAAAAKLLARSNGVPPDVLIELRKSLTDPDPRVRAALARTLGRSDVPFTRIRPDLMPLLSDQDREVRYRAMEALGRFGKRDAEARKVLLSLLNGKSTEIRGLAVREFANLGDSAAEALPALLSLLENGAPEVRVGIALILARLEGCSGESVPALTRASKSEDSKVRARALWALGEIGGNPALSVPALTGALEDPDKEVRSRAVYSLAAFGAEAAPAVLGLMKCLKEKSVRLAYIFRTFSKIGPAASPAALMAAEALNHRNQSLREAAKDALVAMGPAAVAAKPALVEMLRGEDRTRQEAALSALAGLGDAARDLAPEMFLIFRRFRYWGSGKAAAKALVAMGPQAFVDALRSSEAMNDYTIDKCAELLKEMRGTPALLPDLFQDTSRTVLLVAMKTLEKTSGDKEWKLSLLTPLTKCKDEKVRLEAHFRIGQLKLPASRTSPIFLAVLGDENGEVRQYASWALYETPPETKEGMALLVRSLTDPDATIRGYVACTLGKLGTKYPPAVSHLIEAIADPDENTRRCVAMALGQIGPAARGAAPRLRTLLIDKAWRVRLHSAAALWKVGEGDNAALDVLIRGLKDVRWVVRSCAADRLRDIGAPAAAAAPVLAKALSDWSEFVRDSAAHALKEMGPAVREAVPGLVKALKDESEDVRHAAAIALGNIGHGSKSVISGLEALSGDDDHQVREAAAESLRKLREKK